ncbi:MAG: trimeric intracellular cation channel family protein [Clostridia bacterium]|nr:trimeric intracellular cation channel family protein [Clostridia bacterium]
MTEWIRYILEIAGTIAFAVSGALVAIGAGLDLFGVIFIGAVTAVGGGIMRDILLGINPPSALTNLTWIGLAIFVSLAVFAAAYIMREKFNSVKSKIEHINNIFDACGLAAFTVTGAEVAIKAGFSDNFFVPVLLGMITGVGGGIFRDILTNATPYVLKKHVYALASIAGGLVYYFLSGVNPALASAVAIFVVFAIRILATKYRWSLPKVNLKDE